MVDSSTFISPNESCGIRVILRLAFCPCPIIFPTSVSPHTHKYDFKPPFSPSSSAMESATSAPNQPVCSGWKRALKSGRRTGAALQRHTTTQLVTAARMCRARDDSIDQVSSMCRLDISHPPAFFHSHPSLSRQLRPCGSIDGQERGGSLCCRACSISNIKSSTNLDGCMYVPVHLYRTMYRTMYLQQYGWNMEQYFLS